MSGFGFGNSHRYDPGPQCDRCGGPHENVPTVNVEVHGDEVTAACPHMGCDYWVDFDVDHPSEIERHPATPLDDPVTVVCKECNGAFYVRID